MRFLSFAILGFLLMAMPAMGQDRDNDGRLFGSTTCRQKVPCLGDNSLTVDGYIANANACLAQSFGLNMTSGFFDEILGFDDNGCLANKTDQSPQGGAKSITPKCCVITLPDNSCTFYCRMLAH
jgi:hypothetical protein